MRGLTELYRGRSFLCINGNDVFLSVLEKDIYYLNFADLHKQPIWTHTLLFSWKGDCYHPWLLLKIQCAADNRTDLPPSYLSTVNLSLAGKEIKNRSCRLLTKTKEIIQGLRSGPHLTCYGVIDLYWPEVVLIACTTAAAAVQINNTAPLSKIFIVDNEVKTTRNHQGYSWKVKISKQTHGGSSWLWWNYVWHLRHGFSGNSCHF